MKTYRIILYAVVADLYTAACLAMLLEKTSTAANWIILAGFLLMRRSGSFMDLAAPHDEVLTQKDQANTVFLLHGYG